MNWCHIKNEQTATIPKTQKYKATAHLITFTTDKSSETENTLLENLVDGGVSIALIMSISFAIVRYRCCCMHLMFSIRLKVAALNFHKILCAVLLLFNGNHYYILIFKYLFIIRNILSYTWSSFALKVAWTLSCCWHQFRINEKTLNAH